MSHSDRHARKDSLGSQLLSQLLKLAKGNREKGARLSRLPVALLCALVSLPAQHSSAQDFASRFASIRDSATRQELYSLLHALPKGGDIHHHGGLSFLAEPSLDIATRLTRHGYRYYTRTRFTPCSDNENGPILLYLNLSQAAYRKLSECRQADFTPLDDLSPAQRREWISAHILDHPTEGRNEFFEEIVPRLTALMRNPYFFAEGFADNLKRFHKEGVRYLEVQYLPIAMERPDGTLMPADEAIAILKARLAQPDMASVTTRFRFQTTIIRFRDDLERQIAFQHQWVDEHRDLWVGINAAGREDNDKGYALRMLNAFREARRRYSNIPLSLHAGEKDSPGHEVRDTLLLGARRIGHGINLISDPDTMLLMRDRNYLVEINLVSNRLLEYTPDLSKHPFPEYLRFGIPVCLNTDDRGSWDSTMTDEYFHAVTLFRLTWDEIRQIGRASLTHSFAPEALKQQMLAEYDRDVAAFEQRFAAGDWRAELTKTPPTPSGYALRNLLK